MRLNHPTWSSDKDTSMPSRSHGNLHMTQGNGLYTYDLIVKCILAHSSHSTLDFACSKVNTTRWQSRIRRHMRENAPRKRPKANVLSLLCILFSFLFSVLFLDSSATECPTLLFPQLSTGAYVASGPLYGLSRAAVLDFLSCAYSVTTRA